MHHTSPHYYEGLRPVCDLAGTIFHAQILIHAVNCRHDSWHLDMEGLTQLHLNSVEDLPLISVGAALGP